jgi:nucleobase:cation symporter-1, NCS1 family
MVTREQEPHEGPRAGADAGSAVVLREGEYGDRVIAVEPGGAEFIPLSERHGGPRQLLWTWTSPNMEFATVFVGVLAVALFGLSFWLAVVAILLGTAAGSITLGLLSARGPGLGVPQMVISRLGFGYWGNVLPAGINAITAGIGWFAVNSVSGAFALNTLLDWPKPVCLLIVVLVQVSIAFFGHNLVHAFERYAFPVLTVIFLIAAVIVLTKAHPGAGHVSAPGGSLGGFLLTTGATFGYAVGWNPYASDYTRYLPAGASRKAVAGWAAAGLFGSCVLLEIVGAASVTIGGAHSAGSALSSPTGSFTGHLPTAIGDLTLLAIALGAVAANVLNIYSGALSFVAMGIRLPLALRRAIVALVFGAIGFVVALFGLHNAAATYDDFLLVIAYWIAPWLAVVLADQVLRRREPAAEVEPLLFDTRHRVWAGPIAMVAGMAISIWLFSNQSEYVGLVPAHVPAVGDITFEAGFVLTALVYVLMRRAGAARRSAG